jgi:hypothetical protein
MLKSKQNDEKGTQRARWRECFKCPPERKSHKVLPKIYHETFLPGYYADGEYVCEECLEIDLHRHERMVDIINRELQRRDEVYRQAGY